MATIKQPFGASLNSNFYGGVTLASPTAAQPTASYTLTSMFNILNVPTVDNRKVKLTINFDDDLPIGAVLNIRCNVAKGTGIYFATGSLTSKASTFKIGVADADGTGHWSVGFVYDGVGLLPNSFVNLNAGKISLRG